MITERQRSCGNVMFAVMSVGQSVILSTEVGCHVITTHDVLDLTVSGTPSPTPPSEHGISLYTDPHPPASDTWWPSLKTCSNLFTLVTPT